MNPFYFGSSDQQLFGIHHPPEGTEVRDGAVLICPPWGPEYIAAHRPLQQLAVHLSRAGFHVLRFDFYGCGDSAGELEDATIAQWIEDVGTAAQELRDTSGSRRLTAIGLRLGGTVVALAGARAVAAGARDQLACVLFEPVLRGGPYVEELFAAQAEWVRGTFPKPKPATLNWPVPEVLGFDLPEAIQAELGAIDLLQLAGYPAENVLVMQTHAAAGPEKLQQLLADRCESASYQMVEHEDCWRGHQGGTIAMVPVAVNQAITRWVSEVYR